MGGQGFKGRDHESRLSFGEGVFTPSMACSRTSLCWERMPLIAASSTPVTWVLILSSLYMTQLKFRYFTWLAGTWTQCDRTSKHSNSTTPCWFCLIFWWGLLEITFLCINLNSTRKWPIKVFFQTNFWDKGELLNSLFSSLDWATFYLNTECWCKKQLSFFFSHHLNILKTQVHADTLSGKLSCVSFLYSFFLWSHQKQMMPAVFYWPREDHYHLMFV